MRVLSPFVVSAFTTSILVALTSAHELKLNGWYPCAPAEESGAANSTAPAFECAEVEVPLCHEGICESDKTIDLFVKRLLADPSKQATVRKALWLLQGGPGESSVVMEGSMIQLSNLLDSSVDMYTTDHRGTGRSNFLECKAAQAFARGGPSGILPDYKELPSCAKDILFQIDNKPEAFSVTSAAKDMEYLTSHLYGEDVATFVYGVSYGTYFTERIMHLAPKHVKGYILDGVVPEDNPSFTTTNADRVLPAERLAKACEEDEFCSSKFEDTIKASGDLFTAWKAIYDALDTASPGSNKCADLLRAQDPTMRPSDTLRGFLGGFASDIGKRVAVPAFLYRVSRCDEKDEAFFRQVFGALPDAVSHNETASSRTSEATTVSPTVYDQVGETSHFLAGVIKASEMWTHPSPSWDDELKEYQRGLFPFPMATDFAWYCYFTAKFDDPACTYLKETYLDIDFTKVDMPVFAYTPDEKYWHKFATIPDHASVLVMNGKLDFQTVSDGGVREYENLKGGEKMMVEFEYGGHGVGILPSTFSDTTSCGFEIIASFVAVDGRTADVNITCMDSLPAIDFTDLDAIQTVVPGLASVEDFYEADPASASK